jgi:hypothetical protein
MNAANDLLQSLKDFGWPIVAYVLLAPVATYLLPSTRSRRERGQRLLLVGAIILGIELIFFLLTSGGDILHVIRERPAWGFLVVCLFCGAVLFGIRWARMRARLNQEFISVTAGNASIEAYAGRGHLGAKAAAIGLWTAGCLAALLWLSKIASGH